MLPRRTTMRQHLHEPTYRCPLCHAPPGGRALQGSGLDSNAGPRGRRLQIRPHSWKNRSRRDPEESYDAFPPPRPSGYGAAVPADRGLCRRGQNLRRGAVYGAWPGQIPVPRTGRPKHAGIPADLAGPSGPRGQGQGDGQGRQNPGLRGRRAKAPVRHRQRLPRLRLHDRVRGAGEHRRDGARPGRQEMAEKCQHQDRGPHPGHGASGPDHQQ